MNIKEISSTKLLLDKEAQRVIEKFMLMPGLDMPQYIEWNDVMMIIDKIESIPCDDTHKDFTYQFTIESCVCVVSAAGEYEVISAVKDTRISAAMEACLNFIEYYNQK